MDIEFGNLNLTIQKTKLSFFLDSLVDEFYKDERLIHLTHNKKEFPSFKISGDIASCRISFKTKFGRNISVIFDGHYDRLNDFISFHSITPNYFSDLNQEEYKLLYSTLKKLTLISNGFLFVDLMGEPSRFSKGQVDNYKKLLAELYNHIPDEKKQDLDPIYTWLSELF